MSDPASSGTCERCGNSFRKSGITRHLQSCLKRNPWPEAQGTRPGGPRRTGIHVSVTDSDRPEYWLHLAVPSNAQLDDLDEYLRRIWLECCGHLSAFQISRDEYHSHAQFGAKGMGVALSRVAPAGTSFSHVYDFGTSTFLTLRSIGETEVASDGIVLLARNDAPEILCVACSSPATKVGPTPDDWTMTTGYCDDCALQTGEDAEELLPVVNSPRSGVCGYDGPWEN